MFQLQINIWSKHLYNTPTQGDLIHILAMTNTINRDNSDSTTKCSSVDHQASSIQGQRAAYKRPELISYGDVRDVTLGPTVGFGESGGGPFCAEGVNCP